jgi:lipopolysaccharide transport system ATP-binding protein
MATPIITVEGLSKRYILRQQQQRRYTALRDVLAEKARGMFRSGGAGTRTEEFLALDDVSFTVNTGDRVGIIGRNGAGKSTLLKVLSQITRPTTGRIRLTGRVGSLLEVGTGFHPELTGRENIYLNGSILGMSRREIDRRFDEIVAFAEIEQFLDTPVKRYSSGMYVRLAFAVAAHLEPEILIVDEVLAVGDATFQKRCTDRMASLAADGRTILLVSHNMDLIPRLCNRVSLLANGRIDRSGPARDIVQDYIRSILSTTGSGDLSDRQRTGDGRARFLRCQMVDFHGDPIPSHLSGEDLILRLDVMSQAHVGDAALAVTVRSLTGANILSSWTRECGMSVKLKPGLNRFECRLQNVRLRPGHSAVLCLWLDASGTPLDFIQEASVFTVNHGYGTGHLSGDYNQGTYVCDSSWSTV